ncbi:hypothetical protein AVEN_42765-1 [Araneus ventricosus]|uniref:Uncharacterized protein n=1 Tax=Araneus ventricosus TaxID=182803 RepID=A0A4Y2AGV3_ARAVE|nr:hypothetical protein AVEN_42765-1 [Araneus ventricosus]
MMNPSTPIQELVVIPECHLPFQRLTGIPVKNEHLIKKEIEEKEVELMTIWTQRTSIMKNASFAVRKEKRNWDSNVLCASSGPIPPVRSGTKFKPKAMQFL